MASTGDIPTAALGYRPLMDLALDLAAVLAGPGQPYGANYVAMDLSRMAVQLLRGSYLKVGDTPKTPARREALANWLDACIELSMDRSWLDPIVGRTFQQRLQECGSIAEPNQRVPKNGVNSVASTDKKGKLSNSLHRTLSGWGFGGGDLQDLIH
jgi:hypothetical protein